MNLFVYGELCRAQTVVRLLGRLPICTPAVLADHLRETNPATGYYQARPAVGQQIVGLLFGEIAAVELERLDEFEDATATARDRAWTGSLPCATGPRDRSAV